MAKKITIDPVTRLEGHLKTELLIEKGRIAKAYISGQMYRGFEQILIGRNPLDAQQIAQRICGVCSAAHAQASALCLESAIGITPPKNGLLLRNLMLASNFFQSHILHFYTMALPDYIDFTAILKYKGKEPELLKLKDWGVEEGNRVNGAPLAPFMPRYEGDYIEDVETNLTLIYHYLKALRMRAVAHQMVALFGGRMPMQQSIFPGGALVKVSIDKIIAYKSLLQRLQTFINNSYLPDSVELARHHPYYLKCGQGCQNFLSYGGFPQENGSNFFPAGVIIDNKVEEFNSNALHEQVEHSYYSSPSGKHPSAGETAPLQNMSDKKAAYSWIKAPRYNGTVMEVGPLARRMIAYKKDPESSASQSLEQIAKKLKIPLKSFISVLGRNIARALEAKLLAQQCTVWLEQLKPGAPTRESFELPEKASGAGMTSAPRGELGHWIQIESKKIARYQCITPTTWNASPRDDKGQPGTIEQALEGVKIADAAQPLEALRIIHSFDP
jgi:Ni,Fe-hydrogenase I large subunit